MFEEKTTIYKNIRYNRWIKWEYIGFVFTLQTYFWGGWCCDCQFNIVCENNRLKIFI